MFLQAFPNGVAASTPLDDTPYLLSQTEFEERFGFTARRKCLLERFVALLGDVRSIGVEPVTALIGGSMLDERRAEPRDLDAAIFYSISTGEEPDFSKLRQVASAAQTGGLDVRLLPFDGRPSMTAKLIGYFAILYSQRREDCAIPPVLVLDLHLSRDA